MSNSLTLNQYTPDNSLLLSLREAQLRIIFETTQDAIVITDNQGRYLDGNPAACQLFGLEKPQLLGRCILEFTEPSLNFPQNWQEFSAPENRLDEFQILRPDGEMRIVAYIAGMNFLPHGHLSIIRDITEQKQAQERVTALEKLLQATEVVHPIDHPELQTVRQKNEAELAYFQKITRYIPGAIYQFTQSADGQMSLPYASEGFKAIYGISPEAVREDATLFLAQLHPDDYASTIASIAESAAHLTRWYCEYRICRDGEVFWLLGEGTPQRDADGGTTWYGYIRDITNQKAKEADLAKLSRYLKKTQEVAKLGYWAYHLATEKLTWSEEVFSIFGDDSRSRRTRPEESSPTISPRRSSFFLE
ncbi:MAG: PAS domain S-box protein, partial [Coleofasciculaceae cyanobacterium SM2_1_6]|nr:PAS domain S-box protein [Coleofasciculaceae cyanobacterium SM2_1_6]